MVLCTAQMLMAKESQAGEAGPGPRFGQAGSRAGNGKRALSDSLHGVDPRGLDGLGEGCEVALVLLGVAL